jgi:DNA-binding response OmpR family regulator
MTTPFLALPLSAPIPSVEKKKRVLLIDTSAQSRELRAEVMRKLGMDIDCAADISEARCWWRADLYDLVLINVTFVIAKSSATTFAARLHHSRSPSL